MEIKMAAKQHKINEHETQVLLFIIVVLIDCDDEKFPDTALQVVNRRNKVPPLCLCTSTMN